MDREQRRFVTGGSASSAKTSGVRGTRGNARVTFELQPSARRRGLGGAAQQRAKVRLDNETHVHPRTPSVKSSVGRAQQTRASAASECSPAGAERTMKSAGPAFGGWNVSYAGRRSTDGHVCYGPAPVGPAGGFGLNRIGTTATRHPRSGGVENGRKKICRAQSRTESVRRSSSGNSTAATEPSSVTRTLTTRRPARAGLSRSARS